MTEGLPDFVTNYLQLQDRVAQLERLIRHVPETIETAGSEEGPAALFARKTADESVTSSTAMQDDDHLFLDVEADSVYEFSSLLQYEADTAGDFRFLWATPSGATGVLAVSRLQTAAATAIDVQNDSQAFNVAVAAGGGLGAGVPVITRVKGLLVVAGTAGVFKLQWAQQSSSVVATTLKTNSFLVLRQMA